MEIQKMYRGTLKRRNLGDAEGTLAVMDGGIQFVSDDGKTRIQDTSEVGDIEEGTIEVLGHGYFKVRSEMPVTAQKMITSVVRAPVKVGASS